MDIYKASLDSLDTNIIIWNSVNSDLICCYNNMNKPDIIVDSCTLVDYLTKANLLDHHNTYTKLVDTGMEQTINVNNTIITLKKLNDSSCKDTYIESHHIKCDNLYLLCSISHKIRQPLTNIIGVMTVVDEFNVTDDEKRYLNIVKKSSYKIVEIANDIIDIVNLESGKTKLNLTSCTLKDTVTTAYEVTSTDIQKKNLKFSYKLASNLPNIIYTDCSRLQQIIVSLISNSVKNTKFGSISLEVSPYKSEDVHDCPFDYIEPTTNKQNILFKIRDTGSGISEDNKKIVNQILNIDRKINNDIKSYKNCGFNLLICRYLANLLGGNLWYKTEVDIGTVFYFNIICD